MSQKTLLLHAIPPESHQPQLDWRNFLQDAALVPLPDQAEQLAPNVWVLPDDGQTYLLFSRLGTQHAIETRTLPFFASFSWQLLSRRP